MKFNNTKIGLLFLFSVVLFACSKEQKQADELNGNWEITQYTVNDSSYVDAAKAKQYFQFFTCERAYTATCQGIYTAQSTDSLFKTVIDTFKYNLNSGNFAITKVKTNNARYLLMRFEIRKLENGEMEMGNDTIVLKAKKI